MVIIWFMEYAGREISEKGGHGNVCFGASYHVLCYVGFLSHKGNYLVIRGDISYHILYNIGHL